MSRRTRIVLGLLASIAVWGANVPILKLALREVTPAFANGVRFSLSAATLGVLATAEMRRAGRPLWSPWREHAGWLVGLGLLGYVGYQEAFILGVTRTSSTSVGLLMATSPLWTALLSHLTGLQRVRRAGWTGLAVSFAGALVVVLGAGRGSGEDTLLGNLIILVGAVLWATFTVLSRRLTDAVPPATATFFEVLVALPVLLVLAALDLPAVDVGAISWGTWAALAFSGVLSVGLTLVAWNAGVATLGPATTGAFSNLTPLATALAAYAILGERLTPLQMAGGALLLGGLVWLRRGLHSAPPAAAALEPGQASAPSAAPTLRP